MDDSEFIVNFCGITGSTTDIALSYMEMTGGNLNAAISLFFDNNGEINIVHNKKMEVESSDSYDDVEESNDSYKRVLELDGFYIHAICKF